MRLAGWLREKMREEIYQALRHDGGWLSTREAIRSLYARYGVDTEIGGWVWGLPEDMPALTHEQAYVLLRELYEDKQIDRKQRIPNATVYWRVERIEVPDTLPADWTREPVAA